jgi:asparagine synthase (glutamine-hydrolysing)
MAQPLELRLPLLKHPVVAIASRARAEWRRSDPRPKPLLIDAVGPRLPSHVWRRKKQGFAFPWESWLRGALAPRAADALASRQTWAELGLNPAAVGRFWDRFQLEDPAIPAVGVLALIVLRDYAERHRLSV